MSRHHQSLDRWKLHAATSRLIAAARAADAPCVRCGEPIDYSLDGRQKQGPTADHIPSLADVLQAGGDPYDPRGMAPAHRSCNARAGRTEKRVVSQRW